MTRTSRRFLALASVVAFGLMASGCAEPGAVAESPEHTGKTEQERKVDVEFNQELHDSLPENIRESGVVRVGTTAYTPPIVFLSPNNEEIIGINADIMEDFSEIFGVDFELVDVGTFASLIPGMKSNRFDMTISGMGDTVERQKEIDMIDYMYDGKTIMVQKGNPQDIQTMEDLCGLKVAVGVGTAQEALVKEQSAKCDVPINLLSIPKQPDVLVAVQTGRADATVGGYATGVYTTKHQIGNGVGLEALPGVREEVGYNAMGFTKTNTELLDAVAGGFQELIDSGRYEEIMASYDVEDLSVDSAKVNDAANLAQSGD